MQSSLLRPVICGFGLLWLSFNGALVRAQATANESPPPPIRVEDLSPRRSVQVFLKAIASGDYELARLFIDFDQSVGLQASRTLTQISASIDQKLQIKLLDLSAKVEGDNDDGLPTGKDLLARVATRGGMTNLYMIRKELKDHALYRVVWQIDRASAQILLTLNYQDSWTLAAQMPPMLKYTLVGLGLWQWLGLLAALGLALGLGLLVRKLFFKLLSRSLRLVEQILPQELLHRIGRPVQGLLTILAFNALSPALELGLNAREIIDVIERVLFLICSLWLLQLLVVVGFGQIKWRLEKEGKVAAVALLPSGKAVVQVLIVLIGLIMFAQNLGYDVTTLVAGLGVGGIAVAFAAQKTIENLICGFMILMDQPVKVGDYCKFGTNEGTVERIGLRSTRVRTLERTLVTIPNAEFSQYNIENLAERDRIRLVIILGVRYETSSDQMRYILAELNRMLICHERVITENIRVRFVRFADYSQDIEVVGYVDTAEYAEFLAIREDILLLIMDIVADAGTDFAFPSQTLYMERSSGIDRKRASQVESIVQGWRQNSHVPLPNFPDALKAEMSNTRTYPAKESWLQKESD